LTTFVLRADRDFDFLGVLDFLTFFNCFLKGDFDGERLDLERLVLSPRLLMIFLTLFRIELGLAFFFFRDLAVLNWVLRVDLVLRED